MDQVSLKLLIEENKYLEVLNETDLENMYVEETEISRPGLALVNQFGHFSENRVLLFGDPEYYFVDEVEEEVLNTLMSKKIPLIIFTRGNRPSERFLKIANKYNKTVCLTDLITSTVFHKIHEYLEEKLALQTQVHGVMLNIHGKGVLLQGASGIGKSEVALELVKKGHILIADDMVILKNIDGSKLVGEAPDLLKSKMEIRGIGIVDIQKLFGVTSVLLKENLDLIIELTNSELEVDRIGNNYQYKEILGVKKKKINIPVMAGKNLSSLIEVAVANFQLAEDYGYSSSEEFIKSLNNMLKETNETN
ncbi:MAG: HPr(Ser) kinase/phosphatase [Mycoplasmatales bacterium]